MNSKRTETTKKLYAQLNYKRMHVRTARMRVANRFGYCLLFVAVCAIVPVSAVPSLRKVRTVETKYEGEWLTKLQDAVDAKDFAKREHKAIHQDPLYLEVKARERLAWSKKGERILVFPK